MGFHGPCTFLKRLTQSRKIFVRSSRAKIFEKFFSCGVVPGMNGLEQTCWRLVNTLILAANWSLGTTKSCGCSPSRPLNVFLVGAAEVNRSRRGRTGCCDVPYIDSPQPAQKQRDWRQLLCHTSCIHVSQYLFFELNCWTCDALTLAQRD